MNTRSGRDRVGGRSAEQFGDVEAAGARAPQSAKAVPRNLGLEGGSGARWSLVSRLEPRTPASPAHRGDPETITRRRSQFYHPLSFQQLSPVLVRDDAHVAPPSVGPGSPAKQQHQHHHGNYKTPGGHHVGHSPTPQQLRRPPPPRTSPSLPPSRDDLLMRKTARQDKRVPARARARLEDSECACRGLVPVGWVRREAWLSLVRMTEKRSPS